MLRQRDNVGLKGVHLGPSPPLTRRRRHLCAQVAGLSKQHVELSYQLLLRIRGGGTLASSCVGCRMMQTSIVLYFAYGSNMSRSQMAIRCPRSQPRGVALLRGWRFLINRRGFATIVPDSASFVYGILWDVPADDLRSLDEKEGVKFGTYRRDEVDLDVAGERLAAQTYIARDDVSGEPMPGYLERVIEGAREFRLPGAYITELEQCQTTKG